MTKCWWHHEHNLGRHNLYFEKTGKANLADILRIAIMLIKTAFKDSTKRQKN